MQKIVPHLWFDAQAEEAVHFYTSIFPNSKTGTVSRYGKAGQEIHGREPGSVMTVDFELAGYKFMALNGGPIFTFSEATSFFVNCATVQEVNSMYEKLSAGGQIMMALDKYPFSERYAFIKDKFGVAWQLIHSPDAKQVIVPSLLFVADKLGQAADALTFYTAVFRNSSTQQLMRYEAGQDWREGQAGTVMYSLFTLEGQEFTAMDGAGPHQFTFNESISFLVYCKDQTEIDYYWNKLSADPRAEQCGWLKDKFGVSWQIVPENMGEWLKQEDPAKFERVMAEVMKMKKFDLKRLDEVAKEE